MSWIQAGLVATVFLLTVVPLHASEVVEATATDADDTGSLIRSRMAAHEPSLNAVIAFTGSSQSTWDFNDDIIERQFKRKGLKLNDKLSDYYFEPEKGDEFDFEGKFQKLSDYFFQYLVNGR